MLAILIGYQLACNPASYSRYNRQMWCHHTSTLQIRHRRFLLCPTERNVPSKDLAFDESVMLDYLWMTWTAPWIAALQQEQQTQSMWPFDRIDCTKAFHYSSSSQCRLCRCGALLTAPRRSVTRGPDKTRQPGPNQSPRTLARALLSPTLQKGNPNPPTHRHARSLDGGPRTDNRKLNSSTQRTANIDFHAARRRSLQSASERCLRSTARRFTHPDDRILTLICHIARSVDRRHNDTGNPSCVASSPTLTRWLLLSNVGCIVLQSRLEDVCVTSLPPCAVRLHRVNFQSRCACVLRSWKTQLSCHTSQLARWHYSMISQTQVWEVWLDCTHAC